MTFLRFILTCLYYSFVVFLFFSLLFSAVTDATVVVTDVPTTSVPPPLMKPAALEVAPAVPAIQTEDAALPVEVLDSLKVVFPGDEFANFDTLSMFLMTRAKDF